jgi:hypothetical protein
VTTQDHTLDGAITRLRSPRTIRARCAQIAGAVRRGDSRWFEIDDAGLEQAAALVAAVTR